MRLSRSFAGGPRRGAGAAAIVLAAAAAGGCGSGAGGTPPASHPPATGHPATSAPAAPSTAAPAAGTRLATQPIGPDNFEVISGGVGFSIVDGLREGSPSTITTYDAAGHKLATITGGYTSICGAADVEVPGTGRLIITELITGQAAEGIKPATSSLTLTAWNADSGAKAWTATVVHSVTASLSCITETALSYLDNGPDLLNFGVTTDGRWGVYANGAQKPAVVNLSTGAVTPDPAVQGTLGRYLIDACQSNNMPLVLDTLTDAQTGAAYGKFTTEADAYHVNASCAGRAAAGAARDLSWFSANTLQLAPAGLFVINAANTASEMGLTSAGTGLLVDNAASVDVSNPDILRYALPGMRPVWKKFGTYTMWGDGGGIEVVTKSNAAGADSSLIGLNDETGAQEWKTNGSGSVCAVTSTEILYAVNGQLATLNVKTGKQISYGPQITTFGGHGNCPAILPNGIVAQSGNGAVTVTQMITP